MNKKLKIVSIIAVIVAALYYTPDAIRYYFYLQLDDFNKKLIQHKENTPEVPIYLKDLTDFKWDEVCFYGPGSSTRDDSDIPNFKKSLENILQKDNLSLKNEPERIAAWGMLFKNYTDKTAYYISGAMPNGNKKLWNKCFEADSKIAFEKHFFIYENKFDPNLYEYEPVIIGQEVSK